MRRASTTVTWCALVLCACEARVPEAATERDRPALKTEARTALVAVDVDATGGAEVGFAALKSFSYRAPLPLDADLRVSVFEPGATEPLGTGEARLRPLCTCGGTQPHGEGDVEVRHRDTVMVKVPYRSGSESLRVERRDSGGAWHVVATAALEGAADARR